jgi:hypothetical protein
MTKPSMALSELAEKGADSRSSHFWDTDLPGAHREPETGEW